MMLHFPAPLPSVLLAFLLLAVVTCSTPAATEDPVSTLDTVGDTAGDTSTADTVGPTAGLPAAKKLYDPLGVHTVAIELPAADLQAILADAKDVQRDRVFHAVTVTFDGEKFENVGARVFGDGSMQTNPKKPNVRIKFNQFTQGFDGPENVHNLRLKASGADPTFLREPLFYHLLNESGATAPRFSFARVTINGESYGLYQILEHADGRMFKHAFGNETGNDYEAINACVGLVCPTADCSTLQQSFQVEKGDFSDLRALALAMKTTPDAQLEATISQYADLDALLAVYAAEGIAADYDGVSASGTNFEVYNDEATGKLHVIRGGADGTFYVKYALFQPWGAPNVWCGDREEEFFKRMLAVPSLKAKLEAKYREMHCGVFDRLTVLAWLEQYAAPLKAEIANDAKTIIPASDMDGHLYELKNWIVQRDLELKQVFGSCP
jgi:spore coat protein CotH